MVFLMSIILVSMEIHKCLQKSNLFLLGNFNTALGHNITHNYEQSFHNFINVIIREFIFERKPHIYK